MSRTQFPLSDSQMQALPVELRGVLKTVIDFYDAQLTQLREENKLLQTENNRVARPLLAVGSCNDKMDAPYGFHHYWKFK